MTTANTHSDPVENSVDSCLVQLRGRPVRLERQQYGWSANVVERGYFPVSPTGYRSFSTGNAAGEPPSLKALEELSVQFDSERAKALKGALGCLAERFAEIHEEGCADEMIGRHISLDMAAQRAFEHGSFAPESERVALWEAAFLLFDRLARDPLVRPLPNGHAWSKSVCDAAVEGAQMAREALRKFMAGDFEMPGSHFRLRPLARLAELDGPPFPALSIPCLDLHPFPSALERPTKSQSGHSVVLGGETRDDGEDSEDLGQDEAEEGHCGVMSETCSAHEQLSLF